jgi:hypothetical protein
MAVIININNQYIAHHSTRDEYRIVNNHSATTCTIYHDTDETRFRWPAMKFLLHRNAGPEKFQTFDTFLNWTKQA